MYKLLKKWQKILRLQDKDIQIRVVDLDKNEHESAYGLELGSCSTTPLSDDVDIRMLNPKHYPKEVTINPEHVLVHELTHAIFPIHLLGRPYDPSDPRCQEYERAINKMATILYTLQTNKEHK